MAWARAALVLGAVVAVALVLVSGGSDADPRTPAALPGMPPPFLGTAVTGSGGLTAAVDAYGDVVDLRGPGPAGEALIDNPSARQTAGTVAPDTGIVPRVSIEGGPALPLWRADSVSQRYLAGTSVVRTVARFGRTRVVVLVAALGDRLAVVAHGSGRARTSLSIDLVDDPGRRLCTSRCGELIEAAIRADRSWLAGARPLAGRAPPWAREMYRRSLLTLRALTDRRTGAVAAGARDSWAYVWPRDAATAALALTAAGYRAEARRIVDFLTGVDVGAAARFHGNGSPVGGRGAQGDAFGWIGVAAAPFGVNPGAHWLGERLPDYREESAGLYLGNVLSIHGWAAGAPKRTRASLAKEIAGGVREEFRTPRGLVRRADDPASGLDSAAAWAVRPFSIPPLYLAARRTLLHLTAAGTRFGITPGEGWTGGVDPWTAPTAWTAWAFAALADTQRGRPALARADRRQALRLLSDLRRAATPAGSLPERVDVHTGIPTSTTPLAWSHAFAILALRQLWPGEPR